MNSPIHRPAHRPSVLKAKETVCKTATSVGTLARVSVGCELRLRYSPCKRLSGRSRLEPDQLRI